jgi:phosphatidylglycerophosphate synthase
VLGLIGQVALLAGLAGAVGLSVAGWVAGVVCGLLGNAALAYGLVRSGAHRLGAANRVTLVRATVVGGVAALIADTFARPTPVSALVVLAAVALVLDAVDGRVARRTGTVSTLGARFDMEVDAFLIFVLSMFVARSVGPWVLMIGVARYAFVVAGWLLPWLREPVPPRYWCKVVAAIQGIVLTIAAAGILPGAGIEITLLGAGALLAESFGREVWWLWPPSRMPARHRVEPRRVVHAPVA